MNKNILLIRGVFYMAMYFSMVAENGEVVINRARWLIGDIWDIILKEKGQLSEGKDEMDFYKDYYIDLSDIPRVIEYYEDLIKDKVDDGFGMYSLIRYSILPRLRNQIEFRVSEHRKYIVRWD